MKKLLLVPALFLAFTVSVSLSGADTSHAGEMTIMATGDILPRASWQPFQIPTGKLFEGVVATLFEADMVIGNLESPLTGGVEQTSSKSRDSVESKLDFVFKAEAEGTAQGLRDAGLTVLTLANNHIMDYRADGLLDTIDRLEKAGIKTAGAGLDREEASRPAVVKLGGGEVVVLAASDVVPKGSEATHSEPGIVSMKDVDAFAGQVRDARKSHPDALLVLSLHWGAEATYKPSVRQKEIAHRLVDEGADLILGHHPHRIQGVEIYNERPIFYSLGNFQFDTNEPGDETFIARIAYKDGSRVPAAVSVRPVRILDGGYPVVLKPGMDEYSAILDRLDELSRQLGVTVNGESIEPLPPAEEQKEGYDYWGT